jgi:hypothetical protein
MMKIRPMGGQRDQSTFVQEHGVCASATNDTVVAVFGPPTGSSNMHPEYLFECS